MHIRPLRSETPLYGGLVRMFRRSHARTICARLREIQFFQSSPPYLYSHALVRHKLPKTAWWRPEEPQPLSHRILAIANGHYGIYFAIFNRELHRDDTQPEEPQHVLLVFADTRPEPVGAFFGKINREILQNITQLKSVSREFLSTWAAVRPRTAKRAFSTREAPFEESFLQSLVDQMSAIYSLHQHPHDLNVIYPLYQALAKHNLQLPSIALYNLVLRLVLAREVDHEPTLEAVESRLTSLLTVYQDALAACARSEACLPTFETYNLVLSGIFRGAAQVVGQGATAQQRALGISKSLEFAQVGTRLLLSLKEPHRLDLDLILPDLATVMDANPHLWTRELMDLLLLFRGKSALGAYFTGFIDLAQHFGRLGMGTKRSLYNYIQLVFNEYKAAVAQDPKLQQHEYAVLVLMVRALVHSDCVAVACKLLDDIFKKFKASLAEHNISPSPTQVSELLSTLLEALMQRDLDMAHSLLVKFQKVPYIPEPSVKVFNNMINRFAHRYIALEVEKRESGAGAEKQVQCFKTMWGLYKYAAVRKDFGTPSCRETLLALSIDLHDHESVYRLLREIMVKEHIVNDWNVTKKVCLYLAHGQTLQHAALLWNLVEQQGAAHEQTNSFLSEHVPYLVMDPQRLLNSELVSRAFSAFRLQEDNIFGVMTVARFLMDAPLSPNDASKASVLLSKLVTEFEDTENHYVQLLQELTDFRHTVKDFVKPDMARETLLRTDLSALIAAHYETGAQKFEEQLLNNATFSEPTWNMMINPTFVSERLGRGIPVPLFIDSLLKLGVSQALLDNLIRLGNEKVNIEALRYFLKHPDGLTPETLYAFAKFAEASPNRYFLSLLADNLQAQESVSSCKKWLGQLFKVLNARDMLGVVYKACDPMGLDVSIEHNQLYLSAAITAVLNVGEPNEAGALFRHYFDGEDGNRALLQSNVLLASLMEYYMAIGSPDVILSRYASLEARSLELKEWVLFAKFVASLSGSSSSLQCVNTDENSKTAVLAILTETSVKDMKKVYGRTKKAINSSLDMFDTAILLMRRAAAFMPSLDLKGKFEHLMRLCRALTMTSLPVSSLISVVHFLRAVGANDILNVLAQKTMQSGQIAPVVNLYFLEVDLTQQGAGMRLIDALAEPN